MRPLPSPFDDIAAGRPARIALRSSALLGARLLTKDLAFPLASARPSASSGLLPDRVLTIERAGGAGAREDPPQARSARAVHRPGGPPGPQRDAVLPAPRPSTPRSSCRSCTRRPSGRACQEFSHIIRRTRGLWITPGTTSTGSRRSCAHSPYEDVRLIVVTDNERILGPRRPGRGRDGDPDRQARAVHGGHRGIHPALTLPVSLDVGTDNPFLLADPLYLGHRQPRLRGAAYDALVEAFVDGVAERWPGCVIQWEDFKQHNALRILDRYRDRVCSFNDDIQGTAAVVLGGILAAMRLARRRGSSTSAW